MKTLTLILLLTIAAPADCLSWPQDNVNERMSQAEKYKKEMNYEKALEIYQQLSVGYPGDTRFMLSCAEVLILMGKETEALPIYQQIVSADPDNLDANIYLGNYYFLTAEVKREALETELKKTSSPTRLLHAEFRKEMNILYETNYLRSKEYFERVMTVFPSAEARRTLDKIEKLEKFLKVK